MFNCVFSFVSLFNVSHFLIKLFCELVADPDNSEAAPERKQLDVLDQVRVEGCYASPSSREAGRMFYNCQRVIPVASCWDICGKDAYLAQQSLSHPFLLVSRNVAVEPNVTTGTNGLFSNMVWPRDVSLMTKRGEEIPFLQLLVQLKQWTSAGGEVPVFTLKLWPQYCEQMLPGASKLPIEDWKLLMASGIHPIPFCALCSVSASSSFNDNGRQELKIHAFRADYASYLSQQCPTVSRQLVAQYTSNQKESTLQSSQQLEVVNVSVHGLHRGTGGPFPTFCALTSNPTECRTEQSILKALEAGTIGAMALFAIPALAISKKEEKIGSLESEEQEEEGEGDEEEVLEILDDDNDDDDDDDNEDEDDDSRSSLQRLKQTSSKKRRKTME